MVIWLTFSRCRNTCSLHNKIAGHLAALNCSWCSQLLVVLFLPVGFISYLYGSCVLVCFDVFVCFSFVQFNISLSIICLFNSCVFSCHCFVCFMGLVAWNKIMMMMMMMIIEAAAAVHSLYRWVEQWVIYWVKVCIKKLKNQWRWSTWCISSGVENIGCILF